MYKEENNFVEAYKALKENRARREAERERLLNEKVNAYSKAKNDYYSMMDAIEDKRRLHGKLLESAKNDALGTILKAIYITALETSTLTDDGIILAENMVDSWIQEKGGASSILNKTRNKTYLLARIAQITEDTAEKETKKAEEAESDDGEEKEKKDDTKEESSEEDSKDEESTDTEEEDSDEDDDDIDDSIGDVDDEEDDYNDDNDPELGFEDDDDSEDSSEDKEDGTEDAEEVIDGMDDDSTESEDDITLDGGEENNGKIFDELDKEEDVKKAVQLIRKRVSDAEETFIKNNAEDKKKITELLGKISDNVKTVEDMSDDDSTESKIAKESAMMYKRQVNAITNDRPLTVFEKMARNLSKSIVANESTRIQFTNEDGTVDTTSIIESTRVMYGFLETLNTIQLEKVDQNYIRNVLDNM